MKKIKYFIYHFEDDKNLAGWWRHYYLFNKKVHTKLICLWRYV